MDFIIRKPTNRERTKNRFEINDYRLKLINLSGSGLEKFNQQKTWGEWVVTKAGRSVISKVGWI